ncbi:MAG: ribonucleoside-diphosphate reductase subunit alpha, partial [Gammaproteobacteria bacterium]|nr:ribonucleoside-diphosphate reductase subunit alpha [Gammaproteobacteria bacterium]
ALEESNRLATERGAYQTFDGSPASKGILQFDMYDDIEEKVLLDPLLDWKELKKKIVYGGLRNSLLLALMPTASTSQILDNNECFEPFTSNLYTRGTLSGTYVISNKHLVRDLEELGLWDEKMKNDLMRENGSVLNISRVPTELKERYKTAYEMSMKTIIDMAADRQRFICQAQSMNLFMEGATIQKLNSMHFYAWKKGLKTGMYYLRSKSAVDAVKFTVEKEEVVEAVIQPIDPNDFKARIEAAKNAAENDEDCEMCGS